MKILIAEDDVLFRSLLKELLSPEFEVEIAQDGLAARTILRQEHAPPMALLDWVMPGMTGPELCRELRADAKTAGTYLILLTAKNDSADILSGLRSGADDYITKPFVAEELRARLRIGRRILELQNTIARQSKAMAESSRGEASLQECLKLRVSSHSPDPVSWPHSKLPLPAESK